MARRTIYHHDPNPARLLDELYFRVERGFRGLPLGDVAGHASRRYTACYGVLCLVQVLVERGVIGPASTLEARGAQFQDKRTSVEFPAAHLLPCDLAVISPAQPPVRLYDLLQNSFNQTWVRLNIFGRTDRVHRLVNVADRSCEAGTDGMVAVFVKACEETVRLSLHAASITRPGTRVPRRTALIQFNKILVSGFVDAARARLLVMGKTRSQFELERAEGRRAHLVDRFGRSVAPQPTDTRLSSPSDEARSAAMICLCQILRIYTDESLIDPHALSHVEGQIGALRFNETVS